MSVRISRREFDSLLRVILQFSPLWEHIAAEGYRPELPLYLLFSGGPDSTALALALMEFRRLAESPPEWKELRPLFTEHSTAELARPFLSRPRKVELTLLHLNHSIRGKADEEAEWVRGFADRHSLNCVVEKVDVPALAHAQKHSLEAVGRRERYRLLNLHLATDENSLGFTAHTLDDHAESVLFNLVEQTGLGGLLGIAPALHGRILRPFLTVSKQELNEFLLRRGQVFLTDESNLVPDRPRTFLRHEILPRLEELNPRVKENILATSAHLADYEGLFQWALHTLTSIAAAEDVRLRQQVALPLMPGTRCHLLSVAQWKEEIQESLSVILNPILIAFRHTASWREATELARAIRRGERLMLREYRGTGGIQFHPPTSLLLLVEADEEPSEVELDAGAKLDPPNADISLRKLSGAGLASALKRLRKWERFVEMTHPPEFMAPRESAVYEAVFSARVPLPLRIRRWRRGERITIAGGGSAKLSDVFTDRKIPLLLRTYWPVVADACGNVLWLPGVVRGRIGRTGPSAKYGFLLQWRVK